MRTIYITKRFISLVVLICIVFVLFISRLVDWQILNGDHYKMKALHSYSYVLKTNPIRGEILDCNGAGIAANSIGYTLILDDFNLPKGKEAENILKMLDLLSFLKIEWNDSFPIIFNNGNFFFDENKQSEIEYLKSQFPVKDSSNPDAYIEYFKKKLNCKNMPNSKSLRDMCALYYSTRVKAVVADNIDANAMCIITEFAIPGFRIEIFSKRYYPFSDLASHLLGYTGLMSAEEYEKYKEKKYPMDAYVGKSGIEKLFEDVLHGIGGQKAFHFSREGTVTGVEDVIESKPGNSVMLTIDSRVQKAAQESLEKNIKAAVSRGARGCISGAAVAINVKTGEIIASASYPNFDLAKYVSDKAYYNDLYNDKTLPLLNRAFAGTYAPGSTFKTFISASALQEGVLGGLEETIYCGGSYNYFSGYRLRCTGHHGSSNLLRALARSCNVFFAELGRRLGLENIVKYAKEFGVDKGTGVELYEADGTLGGIDKNSQYKSESSQAAIGQGAVAITPLQLAKIVAGIASGNNYKVRLVKKVINYTNSEDIEVFPVEYEKINISDENLNMTRKAMREVVLTGLATDFRNYPVAVAAKTGTAQNAGDDHTTFVCYAPFDDPQIAVSVILANGKFGNLSKAVARDIMNSYFGF